jgi:coenzyme F420-reducing hydrogenase gamma subunit
MIRNATDYLVMSLSRTKFKTSEETKQRAKDGLCLGFLSDGSRCPNPACKCGNCNSHYDKVRFMTSDLDAVAKMKVLTNLRKMGAYLFPYEVKEFKAVDDVYRRAAQ